MKTPWFQTRWGRWVRRKLRYTLKLNDPNCPKWMTWIRNRVIDPKKVVPHGSYCYSRKGGWYCCPFWDRDDERDEMESGWCTLLQKGDWEGGGGPGLLWDQVKICDINEWSHDVVYIEDVKIYIGDAY